MSAAELLVELNRRGVELWVEGERLRYRAPQGTLTPDLRERLAAAREQLLAALAGGEVRAADAAPTLPTVVPDPERRHEPFPLTDLQQAYWLGYSSLFELGNVAPHVYAEYDQQDLDFERLERAWQRLVERHEMLRVVIQPDGRQRILPTVPPYQIPLTDLRSLPAPEAEAQILSAREEMCHQGPRLDAWPPFELRAFRLGDAHIRLCWSLALTICDDWSFHVLTEEWRLLYGDPTAALPPLTLSFRDYVLGLAAFESTAAWHRALEYWRERLADLPPAPQLPLARDPAGIDAPRFTRQTRRFGRELWRRFEASARRAGVTPSAALCSVYAEVLATWSHKRRFTLNLLFFNRSPVHPQIEQVMGNFSSTVLLAVDCATPGSFAERAARLQQQLWRDLQHSAVSGIRVLRELGRARGGGARAAVPVVFASNLNTGFDEQETSGRGLGSSFNHLQTAHVWLDHQVFLLQGELILNWDVVQGLFPDGLPEAMFAAYCELLERLAAAEEAWQEPVRGLVPGEQLRLREQVNTTEAPLSDRRLHELFHAQVRSQPDATAVVSTDRRLNYAELGARATWIARRLREEGAVSNTLVAVVLEKGWEQVVATLGILEAGAAYLPVDPALPPERFHYLLEHGRVRIALTQSRLAGRLPWPDGVRLLEIDREPAAAVEEPLPPAAGVQDLAYVIFTSGSTGLPKGVMIDHRGAVNTILDVNRRFAVGPQDRVFALSSLSFDLSVYDFFGMLAAGGTLVLPATADQRDPERWLQILHSEEITVWNSVPALMQMLVDHVESTGDRLPPSLRLVLLSGDWIPLALPDRIRALAPSVRVISLGGATEASIWSILYPIERIDPAWPSVPYGRPMDNQTFWVLDEELENRPVWVPGDLYIGGVGLAKGYWRDEEKTRASFVVHPRTGERLYRTGDLGRYLPGGDIEFLGREDFQVKVQGYRIELGEIEAALCHHPAVQQAVVTATGDTQRGRRLVGYAVPASDPPPEPAALRAFLLERLPEYMVPVSMVLLRELPLTANGKVDRAALPAPGEVRRDGAAGFVAPRDSVERELARIWGELLASGPVGVGDNFFDLGGHSVLVVQLAHRVKQAFGRDLPMAALLERPTLEHLAETLRGGAASPPSSALVPLQTAGTRPPLFCVHPSGGGVFCYRELSRALGGDQPVYGLQTPGLESDRELVARVEDMATSYLAEIASVQPRGPYSLAGWSMGGMVAFEMARQLQDRGEEVALVGLVDTVAALHGAPPDDAELTSWFARDLSGLAASPPGLTPEALRHLDPEARIERLLDWARETGFLGKDDRRSPDASANGGGGQELPTSAELTRFLRRRLPGIPLPADFIALPAFPMTPEGHIDRRALERRADPPPPPRDPEGDDAARLRRLLAVFTTNFQAMLAYVPGSYPGRVVLLKARDGLGKGHPDPSLGWNRVAPHLTLHELAGDHYALLQPPHVATLAATLAGWLERSRAVA